MRYGNYRYLATCPFKIRARRSFYSSIYDCLCLIFTSLVDTLFIITNHKNTLMSNKSWQIVL